MKSPPHRWTEHAAIWGSDYLCAPPSSRRTAVILPQKTDVAAVRYSALLWKEGVRTMGNNKFKILIVEDEANIRSFIKANLETSDYQVLLLAMCLLLRRFRVSYLFSFVTAVVYGFVLDAFMLLGAILPTGSVWLRAIYYVLGMLFCAAGVSAMFHTYISPEVYELFVKEVSAHFGADINQFKTWYDCASCLIGVAMSFLAFGLWHFEGVKWGTILCALINGYVIGRFSTFYEKHWAFCDRFP